MTIDDITNSRLRARLREVSREMMSKTGMPVTQVYSTPEALKLVRDLIRFTGSPRSNRK